MNDLEIRMNEKITELNPKGKVGKPLSISKKIFIASCCIGDFVEDVSYHASHIYLGLAGIFAGISEFLIRKQSPIIEDTLPFSNELN